MARNILVSCLGPGRMPVDSDAGIDSALRAARKHLSAAIDPVLPDAPDLIILPEACDRPDSFSIEKRKGVDGAKSVAAGAGKQQKSVIKIPRALARQPLAIGERGF